MLFTVNNLPSLLSFAVGALLGDVFLHLLPEAYRNVTPGYLPPPPLPPHPLLAPPPPLLAPPHPLQAPLPPLLAPLPLLLMPLLL